MIATEEEFAKFKKLPPSLKRIAAYIALGCDSVEIAQELGLSSATIHSYKTRLRQAVAIEPTLKLAVFIVRHPQIEKMLRESL